MNCKLPRKSQRKKVLFDQKCSELPSDKHNLSKPPFDEHKCSHRPSDKPKGSQPPSYEHKHTEPPSKNHILTILPNWDSLTERVMGLKSEASVEGDEARIHQRELHIWRKSFRQIGEPTKKNSPRRTSREAVKFSVGSEGPNEDHKN